MISLIEIKNRADQLSAKTEAGSITPEEVGALIADLALYTQSSERDGSTFTQRLKQCRQTQSLLVMVVSLIVVVI